MKKQDAPIMGVVDEKKHIVKKKIKLKGKSKIIPIIIGSVVLCVLLVGFIVISNNQALKNIKKNYSHYVITTKNTKLYNKNKKVVGSIQKNMELELKKIKSPTIKNKYLSIEGTPYYISYKDIKKTNRTEKKEEESYYLPINVHINTKNKVQLLLGSKDVIQLNKGIDWDITYMDDKNYYIDFQGQELTLSKSKDIKETTTDKKIENAAEKISVIYYERIEQDCEDDACLKVDSVKAHINRLKKEGFYFITKDDYLAFINGYRNLLQKAVFLTTGEENDFTNNIKESLGVEVAQIKDEDGIKMQTTNLASSREDSKDAINRYQAKHYTLIDDYSNMANGYEIADNGRQNSTNQSVGVMNYHFFYDASKGETCNESICLEVSKFREHLQWLNDNGYKTLTIHEFADWMDGLIEIPDKSVLLTIDDGAMGTGAHNGNILIPTLEEYNAHATLFLITGWWDISNYQSPNLDVQSHTHSLHEEQSCSDGRGSFVCANYETAKSNLEESLGVLGDNTSFCFPFYSYDNESLQAIQELGFRDAFIGGNVKARRSNNHLLIPRYPILSDISLNQFIYYVS